MLFDVNNGMYRSQFIVYSRLLCTGLCECGPVQSLARGLFNTTSSTHVFSGFGGQYWGGHSGCLVVVTVAVVLIVVEYGGGHTADFVVIKVVVSL